MADEALIGLDEAAARVGHSPWALRRAVARGDLVAYKPCGRIRIKPADLEAWLEASRIPANPTPRPGRSQRTSRASGPGSFRERAKRAREDGAQ